MQQKAGIAIAFLITVAAFAKVVFKLYRFIIDRPKPVSQALPILVRRGQMIPRGQSVPKKERSLEKITQLLVRMQAGDESARDALFAAAYTELRRLARSRLHEGGRNTMLDTTSLVHESYMRYVKVGELQIGDRRAFFGYASRVMRSVIVDSARERCAECRGGGISPLTLSTNIAENLMEDEETIIKIHEALEVLEQADPRLAKVVEMRYFGGYSEREIAETLEVTERTVERDWQKARLILARALT